LEPHLKSEARESSIGTRRPARGPGPMASGRQACEAFSRSGVRMCLCSASLSERAPAVGVVAARAREGMGARLADRLAVACRGDRAAGAGPVDRVAATLAVPLGEATGEHH
jgi:hypothetical protein